ncbi:hypothetical protein NKJ93_29135 [Mesorhizobium sp. M0028]|uniref:hypothetical protein n=1 Tax=Mesorhizobium sp. M0028 TaxID=2956849 RepID=UPI003336B71A
MSHLASGEFICDAYSDLGLKLVRLNRSFRATGAELHWAINDPRDLERSVPGLRLVEETMAYKPEHAARVSWFAGLVFRLWSHVPALRRVGRLLRFRF